MAGTQRLIELLTERYKGRTDIALTPYKADADARRTTRGYEVSVVAAGFQLGVQDAESGVRTDRAIFRETAMVYAYKQPTADNLGETMNGVVEFLTREAAWLRLQNAAGVQAIFPTQCGAQVERSGAVRGALEVELTFTNVPTELPPIIQEPTGPFPPGVDAASIRILGEDDAADVDKTRQL